MTSYTIENLSCAGCAKKIEKNINKLPFVNSATINFTTQKLLIDTSNLKKVAKEIKKIEPDVSIKELRNQKSKGKESLISLVVYLVIYFILLSQEEILSSILNGYILTGSFIILYLINGWKTLRKAFLNILKGDLFDENFLMTIATVGACFINALPEAAGVMIFYRFGLYFESLAMDRSRKSISELLDTKADIAHRVENDKIIDSTPGNIKVGDIIAVKSGERIPLDGIIKKGRTSLDTSQLTGESIPRDVKEGDLVLSGMIVNSKTIYIKVTKPYNESTLSRITKMVEEAANQKASTEKFITKFARVYTPIVVIISALTATVPSLLLGLGTFSEWTYRGLVLLVISCPCALVISIPLAYFGGIGAASKKGILIKGSNYIDNLSRLKTIAFDKTGTLTEGVFSISKLISYQGADREEILGVSTAIEENSNHPLALAICNYAKKHGYNHRVSEIDVVEIPGGGMKGSLGNIEYFLGNREFLLNNGIESANEESNGTLVLLAKKSSNETRVLGGFLLEDQIKKDSSKALALLSNYGVKKQYMLTGDREVVARTVARKLNLNYYSDLLPQDKGRVFKELKDGTTAFVGDGINDAPVLAMADIGISMGSMGSDAAIESSDIIIMNDSLQKIGEAVKLSRKTKKVVYQNIAFALGIKIAIMGFGIAGLSGMWEAVFADVGVTLLAVLNTLRLLKK